VFSCEEASRQRSRLTVCTVHLYLVLQLSYQSSFGCTLFPTTGGWSDRVLVASILTKRDLFDLGCNYLSSYSSAPPELAIGMEVTRKRVSLHMSRMETRRPPTWEGAVHWFHGPSIPTSRSFMVPRRLQAFLFRSCPDGVFLPLSFGPGIGVSRDSFHICTSVQTPCEHVDKAILGAYKYMSLFTSVDTSKLEQLKQCSILEISGVLSSLEAGLLQMQFIP
jgi:hypothetical protein